VIELIEGCANRSNAFCWACDTTECVRQMSVQFLHIIQWNNNRMFIEDLWYFQQIIFFCVCACVHACTHTHTHTYTLVLAHKIGYRWKCYLTGYSIVYLPVWESRHPQLCLVAYITCSLNSWSIYFCLYCITLLLYYFITVLLYYFGPWVTECHLSFGFRMLSKH